MANVTVVAPFRDCADRVAAYRDRICALSWAWDAVRVVAVEGDSRDGTRGLLYKWADEDRRVQLVRFDTGQPKYGSVIDLRRFAALAQVFNAGLDAADLTWSDYVLMLPSDIEYGPDLLERLTAHDADLVAPLVFMNNRFYDIWALGKGLVEMDTVGGTLLMKADVLRAGVRYGASDVDRGLCVVARQRGYRVWADTETWVYHPTR